MTSFKLEGLTCICEEYGFRVALDIDASSPSPGRGIWRGQHQCVTDKWTFDAKAPSEDKSQKAIIQHQLANDRGHFSVLNFAFVLLHFDGFDHNTVMQIVRHRDSTTLLDEDLIAIQSPQANIAYLVQSGRYTGDRFIQVADGELAVSEVFYTPPVGIQRDREGNRFDYTQEMRDFDLDKYHKDCLFYKSRVELGQPYEDARYGLPQCYRQAFSMGGTLEALWHWLDQRTKGDAQGPARVLADMTIEVLKGYSPALTDWYLQHRYKKARLAP